MSILIILRCDACLTEQALCSHYSPLTNNKGGITIEDAISLGWKVNDKDVLCPDCNDDTQEDQD